MKNHNISPAAQQGSTLIILLLILVIAGTAALFSILDGNAVKNARYKKSTAALAEAKNALIGYSTSYKRPGVLPCPDTNNDGVADTNGNLGCWSGIGRLPWKTLGLDDIRDGNGESLWYALSANFANVPSSLIINSDDSFGGLFVCPENGCGDASPVPSPPLTVPFPIAGKLVALVFSSGTVLNGQNRLDGVDLNPNPALNIDNAKKSNNYLDAIYIGANQFNNATGSSNGNDFISGELTSSFNDRVLTISTAEIFNNVNKRMQAKATLAEVATCMISYANNNPTASDKRLPWATSFIMVDHNNKLSYDDNSSLYTGHIAYSIDTSTASPPINGWNTGSPSKKQKMEYCSTWPVWWDSWKKDIFYAVSRDYAPNAVALIPQSCSAVGCVTVDGGLPYAALLIYSGKALAGQSRLSNQNVENPNNYLESKNSLEIINNSGSGDFTNQTSLTMNDVLVCIRQNLTIDLTCSSP